MIRICKSRKWQIFTHNFKLADSVSLHVIDVLSVLEVKLGVERLRDERIEPLALHSSLVDSLKLLHRLDRKPVASEVFFCSHLARGVVECAVEPALCFDVPGVPTDAALKVLSLVESVIHDLPDSLSAFGFGLVFGHVIEALSDALDGSYGGTIVLADELQLSFEFAVGLWVFQDFLSAFLGAGHCH